MLKQRIITGLILIAIVIASVLYLPAKAFAIFSAVVVLGLGGWEWARLTGLNEITQQILFIVALALFALAIYLSHSTIGLALSVAGVLVWVGILYLLKTYHHGILLYQNNRWLLRGMAFPVLLIAWSSVIILQAESPQLLLYLILLIAAADTSAYFSGKRFGANKLAPKLSPGKTFEGMLGAILGTAIWAILAAVYFSTIYLALSWGDWVFFVLLSMVTALLSIAGDLFESLIKREANQKDSGTILPGHGGILDRIDSLLAAAPFFTAGVILGGIIIYGA